MQSIFLTTTQVLSERWQVAYPEALVINQGDICATDLAAPAIVWLVLAGQWQKHLHESQAAGAKVVALTLNESATEARQLIALGAVGYVHAFSAPEQLRQVGNALQYGGLWLGRDLLQELLLQQTPTPSSPLDTSVLSARELSVAESVAAGNSNKEVAQQLGITERTVKAHLSACFEKLGVRDRTKLAVLLQSQSAVTRS